MKKIIKAKITPVEIKGKWYIGSAEFGALRVKNYYVSDGNIPCVITYEFPKETL